MIINHNISAMNAQRHFQINTSNMDKNLESLSSGLRINKGADDAAGLAVSEKMRAQIRGLNQASRNIQDGVSLVQTTEGFLSETNDVLQRMRELVVQAANGTYTRADRAQINVELDQMIREVNRIHEDAKFNTIKLLDGISLARNSFGDGASNQIQDQTGALVDNPITLTYDAATGYTVSDLGTLGAGAPRNPHMAGNGVVIQSGANTDERLYITIDKFDSHALGLTGGPNDGKVDGVDYAGNPDSIMREKTFYLKYDLGLVQGLDLDVPLSAKFERADDRINNMFAPDQASGIIPGSTRVDINSTERATQSLSVLDMALNKVNKQRADLGAFQNRLEYAMKGVDLAAENLQATESRIRDADMAKEFVEFTKNQILTQSAASMTAQANVRSQLVLRIIQ